MATYTKHSIFIKALHRLGITNYADFQNPQDVKYAVLDEEYPNAIEILLATCDWNFARCDKTLTCVRAENGSYYFDIPNDCIKVREILSVNDGVRLKFKPMGKNIVTSESCVQAVYTRRVTDENDFSPEFVKTLSYSLAAAVALALTKSEQMLKLMVAMCDDCVKKYQAIDANESYDPIEYAEYYEER